MAEEKPKKEEYEVTIISRDEYTTYPKPGVEEKLIAVTYAYADYPPRTIYIPKEVYSPEKEKEEIRKDIETFLLPTPRVYKV